MKALLLTGSGRYADPWHPFAATSSAVAEILRAAGWVVDESTEVESALATIGDDVDLLVTNIGRPTDDDSDATNRAGDGLARFANRGGSVLALHSSLNAFAANPVWGQLLGARWVPGVSMHPPQSVARIHVDGSSDVIAGLKDFDVDDELYTQLVFEADVVPLLTYEFDDGIHPLAWQREHDGSRIVVDALGHGPESWASAGHRQFLERCLDWLTPNLRGPERR